MKLLDGSNGCAIEAQWRPLDVSVDNFSTAEQNWGLGKGRIGPDHTCLDRVWLGLVWFKST